MAGTEEAVMMGAVTGIIIGITGTGMMEITGTVTTVIANTIATIIIPTIKEHRFTSPPIKALPAAAMTNATGATTRAYARARTTLTMDKLVIRNARTFTGEAVAACSHSA